MELIEAAKAIISKLNMKKGFKPDNYENPSEYLENGQGLDIKWLLIIDSLLYYLFVSKALQKHYKVLQATALNQQDMDIDDKTLPKTKQMHEVKCLATS